MTCRIVTTILGIIASVSVIQLLATSATSTNIQADERVFVVGDVHRPGEYTYEEGLTVGDVITKAGGFRHEGAHRLSVHRTVDGKVTKNPAISETLVKPGDTVTAMMTD